MNKRKEKGERREGKRGSGVNKKKEKKKPSKLKKYLRNYSSLLQNRPQNLLEQRGPIFCYLLLFIIHNIYYYLLFIIFIIIYY